MTRVQNRSDLGRYLSLIFYKTYADLRAESERTYAGFLWWVIEPIVSMFVYYLVFSVILSRGGENYVAFLFAGVVPWRWFQSTVLRGSASILSSRGLMQQVYLPKIVLPMVSLLADTMKFAVVFLLMLLYIWLTGNPVGEEYTWLPVVLFVQFVFVAGVTALSAGLVPFVPDLKVVLQNLLRLWFFLSGVFYDLDIFSENAQTYLRLNPMAVILESYRAILLESASPDMVRLGLIGVGSTVVLAFSTWLISRLDYVYPKLKF